jgi:hypothetical protein
VQLYRYYPHIRSWLNDTESSSERILSNDRLADVERSGAIGFELLEKRKKTSKTKVNVADRDVKLVLRNRKQPADVSFTKCNLELLHPVRLEEE